MFSLSGLRQSAGLLETLTDVARGHWGIPAARLQRPRQLGRPREASSVPTSVGDLVQLAIRVRDSGRFVMSEREAILAVDGQGNHFWSAIASLA